MSEPFIGEIKMAGFNYAPQGYALCDGSLMAISQNSALFSLLGTTFGGNGVQTFGLPDLRGRSPVGFGQGPNQPYVNMGEMSGSRSITLTPAQMPMHTHGAAAAIAIPASTGDAATETPSATAYLAKSVDTASGSTPQIYTTTAPTPGQTLAPFNSTVTVQVAGGSQPVSVSNPYTGVNFIIATQGLWPSRP